MAWRQPIFRQMKWQSAYRYSQEFREIWLPSSDYGPKQVLAKIEAMSSLMRWTAK